VRMILSEQRPKPVLSHRETGRVLVYFLGAWVEAGQTVTAALGLLVAALVAYMPYKRRPEVTLEEDDRTRPVTC
jgi:hypothetical protein